MYAPVYLTSSPARQLEYISLGSLLLPAGSAVGVEAIPQQPREGALGEGRPAPPQPQLRGADAGAAP